MVTRHLEFHDSELTAVDQASRAVTVQFNGNVLQWEYEGASGAQGTGWAQRVRIHFEKARVAALPQLPARVSDGEIVAEGSTLNNIVPLPYKCRGVIALHLTTTSGGTLSVLVESIIVTAEGDPTFVETLTDDLTRAHIRVVPYDPSWPEKFDQERDTLERLVGKWVAGGIEHVGSTAVPGLCASP